MDVPGTRIVRVYGLRGIVGAGTDQVLAPHLERLWPLIDVSAIRDRRFSIALDSCHGAGGRLGCPLIRSLAHRTLFLGSEPDGQYEHDPEPTEAHLRSFAAIVPAFGAD